MERPKDEVTDGDELESPARPVAVATFWAEAGVDPVEVALPSGVGLTLRSYLAVPVEATPGSASTDDSDSDEAAETEAEVSTTDETARFLAHRGRLHLFRTAEGLAAFLASDAPHDLQALEGWEAVAKQITAEQLVPDPADRYELDLVVTNLRGGHDAWEPELLIGAGEFARDAAFACGIDDVLAMLAPGTPLDNLDEGLRGEGFLARRRLKKIGAEQAALAWRTVVGRIAQAVTWHD